MTGDFSVVFALYPRVTQLDFTAPFEIFARLPRARCVLASVEGVPIQGDGGITFAGVVRLADVEACELLCVPGGFGTVAAMEDLAYLSELERLAAKAQFVTSVCTGSLLLAAAGLLRGRRAACHWAWRELLANFGVTPDPARIVRDGNIITGGGVTAGIDMALAVMAEIAGVDYAQVVQLALEYSPEPPFDSGRPELARPEIVAAALKRLDAIRVERSAAVGRAADRMLKAQPA
ncbi:MAG TPA: DJ-1/PfpI family protein [Steroidobacteraceae bacterium]|jgi:cyclohexyl-isocyanide hydratase|nr:DJ-1/PfpI family protein [Steroidobacteraceae bacterium]